MKLASLFSPDVFNQKVPLQLMCVVQQAVEPLTIEPSQRRSFVIVKWVKF